MKKRGMNKDISGKLSNRLAYTIIAVLILALIGVGVYAYGTSNPAVFGHSISEIQTCGNGQIMETVNGAWTCVAMPTQQAETDPTVPAWAKQGSPPQVSSGLYGWGAFVSGTGTPPGPGSCQSYRSPMLSNCQCPSGYASVILGASAGHTTTYYSCYKN